jgi:hypothetical protein
MSIAFISKIASGITNQRTRFLNWVDAFWGYDVFIAHRRADAAEYARKLYQALQAERVSCFIDRAVYGPGDSLTVATRRHVAKSTVFVLLGSPEIVASRKPIDWVEEEVNEYLASHRSDPKVMPIDFGDTIANASPSTASPILQKIENFVRIPEALPALARVPSDAVLAAVRAKLDGRRRDRMRVRLFGMAAGVLAVLLILASLAATLAWIQREKAINNETHALAALSRTAAREGRALDGVELGLAAWPYRTMWLERPMLGDAVRYLSLSFSEHPPVAVLNHNAAVNGAVYAADGKRILSWSDDKTLRLWDATTGKAIGALMRHDGPVSGAVYSPDCKRILSWSQDKTLRLWDAATGATIGAIMGHDGPVSGAVYSPDGERVLSWSQDKTLRLWDAATGATIGGPMRHKDTIAGAVYSPDGKRILSWSWDQTLRFWDAATGVAIGDPMLHGDMVDGAVYSSDGR